MKHPLLKIGKHALWYLTRMNGYCYVAFRIVFTANWWKWCHLANITNYDVFIIKTILSIDEFTRHAFDEVGNIHYALSFKWQTMLSLKALYERNISTKHVFISIARVSFIATDNRNKMNTEHNCICIIIPKLLHLCNIYFPNSRKINLMINLYNMSLLNYLIHYIFFDLNSRIYYISCHNEH